MPPKLPQEQSVNEKKIERRKFDTEITNQVLHTLGCPSDLQRIQVRSLWNNHYRVNVFVGSDVATVKLAHSYFLEVDQEGLIITCDPKITKEYAGDIEIVAR